MRSSVSIITLGLAFATSYIVNVEAGFRKPINEEIERAAVNKVRTAVKNGIQREKKYTTGSVRIRRTILPDHQVGATDPSFIRQSKIIHKDKNHTVNYFLSGINFEDIPVQFPKKRTKVVEKPKSQKEIISDDVQEMVSSIRNKIFSSGKNSTRSEKGKEKEKENTREIGKERSNNQSELRSWVNKSRVGGILLDIDTGLRSNYVYKLGPADEDSELFTNAVKGSKGLMSYIESKYGSPPLRTWAKRAGIFKERAETFNEATTLSDFGKYVQSRHEVIKKEFPRPVWVGRKTKDETLLIDMKDLDDITYCSDSETDDDDDSYDDDAGNPDFIINSTGGYSASAS